MTDGGGTARPAASETPPDPAAGVGIGIGHLFVHRRIRRIEKSVPLRPEESIVLVTAGTTGPSVGWHFLLAVAGCAAFGLLVQVSARLEQAGRPLSNIFLVALPLWGPMIGCMVISSLLWKPVGVILTNSRVVIVRTARVTHRVTQVLVDVPRSIVSVGSSLVLNSFTLTAVLLHVHDQRDRSPVRLLFHGPLLQSRGTSSIESTMMPDPESRSI